MNIMKIGVLILFLGVSLSPAGCREARHPLLSASASSDHLKVNSDGTASATGTVLENNNGCARDVACNLQVQVGDSEIRVIYHPGEGEKRVNNTEAWERASKVKKGAHVEVYGKHEKQGALDVIEIYSSDKFYIHVLAD